MQNSITISICQFPITFLNPEENKKTASLYLHLAKEEGADLILFPEMTLSGISKTASEMSESLIKSVSFFRNKAICLQTAIGFGWGKPSSSPFFQKLENHYSIIDPAGTMISDYIKIHPFSYGGETECFSCGNSFQLFDYHNFRIATFICYDMRFPEIFQAASKDADLIILAANWPAIRSMHWKILSRARAIENQVYFAACNCFGNIDNAYYSGDSVLYGPDGSIKKSLSDAPGIITCKITNNVADIRKDFPVKQDRQIQLYKMLL